MFNRTSGTMFKNDFQITSFITVIFLMLSMCILSFIFFAMEQWSRREHWNNTNTEEWYIILGLFSVFFIITLGLFFRVDLTRKFIQLLTVLMTIGWAVFAIFIIQEISQSHAYSTHRFNRNLFPFIGISISFLSYMVGLFTLFGNRVVKGEFKEGSN